MPLPKCAKLGCLAGAAAVQNVGSELGPSSVAWLRERMLSEQLSSGLGLDGTAEDIHTELQDSYALINKIGVGVVYFGSARLNSTCPFWWVNVQLYMPPWNSGG